MYIHASCKYKEDYVGNMDCWALYLYKEDFHSNIGAVHWEDYGGHLLCASVASQAIFFDGAKHTLAPFCQILVGLI